MTPTHKAAARLGQQRRELLRLARRGRATVGRVCRCYAPLIDLQMRDFAGTAQERDAEAVRLMAFWIRPEGA